jgi:hypothetical protein
MALEWRGICVLIPRRASTRPNAADHSKLEFFRGRDSGPTEGTLLIGFASPDASSRLYWLSPALALCIHAPRILHRALSEARNPELLWTREIDPTAAERLYLREPYPLRLVCLPAKANIARNINAEAPIQTEKLWILDKRPNHEITVICQLRFCKALVFDQSIQTPL